MCAPFFFPFFSAVAVGVHLNLGFFSATNKRYWAAAHPIFFFSFPSLVHHEQQGTTTGLSRAPAPTCFQPPALRQHAPQSQHFVPGRARKMTCTNAPPALQQTRGAAQTTLLRFCFLGGYFGFQQACVTITHDCFVFSCVVSGDFFHFVHHGKKNRDRPCRALIFFGRYFSPSAPLTQPGHHAVVRRPRNR